MHDDLPWQTELESLCAQLNVGTLSPSQRNRLAEILDDNPEALDAYLDQIEMEAMLSCTYGLLHRDWPLPESIECDTPKNLAQGQVAAKSWLVPMIAASALILIGLVGWALNAPSRIDSNEALSQKQATVKQATVNQGSSQRGPTICKVSHRTAAKLTFEEPFRKIEASTAGLTAGKYRLDNGILELTFASDESVLIQAPSRFQIHSETHLSILLGQAYVHSHSGTTPAPNAKRGLRLETPSSVAEECDSDFAVQVDSDVRDEDEFHVFRGEVEIHSKRSPYRLNLASGQAIRLDHVTSTPAGIDLDQHRFIRSLKDTANVYKDTVLRLGPVVYYTMEDTGSGDRLINVVEDQYHAKIHNLSSTSARAAGFFGGTSFSMDGMRNQVYAVADDFPKPADSHLSVSAWVYANSRPVWASIAKNWRHTKGFASRGQFHFGLFKVSGCLEVSINDCDNQEVFAVESDPLPLHKWHHVAFVVDDQHLRLYRNGDLVSETSCNGLNGNKEIKPLSIGTKLGDDGLKPAVFNNGFWDGRIDQLAIFNQSLSEDEIQLLYQVGVSVMNRTDTLPNAKRSLGRLSPKMLPNSVPPADQNRKVLVYRTSRRG